MCKQNISDCSCLVKNKNMTRLADSDTCPTCKQNISDCSCLVKNKNTRKANSNANANANANAFLANAAIHQNSCAFIANHAATGVTSRLVGW